VFSSGHITLQHRDMDIVQRVQQRTMNILKGLEHLSYEERLGELGLLCLGKR